ncbi:HNH endonuclease signature motif containing protein, partial [Specibacter sp. RAF43]|uniref:HNH endonuclease signature motif containing protein n=1 Tax=Specibacter sp. RAF43 TaxID=3233057 RepID=UPI003F9D4065
RDMTLEPGHDGMSWLTLHLPAPAAEGIWVHCTRTARSLQGAHENRTLTQLRLDTATTLLLGHHPLTGAATTPAGDAADDQAGTTGNAGGGRTVPTDGTAGGTVTVLAGTAGGTVTVVDGEPPWAHTGAPTAAGDAGEATPATVATTGPAAAASAASAAGAASADRSGGDDRAGAPIAGVLCGDGSGYRDGLVDGIPEEPLREYLEQLEKVRTGMAVTEPPLPAAQILVTVPLVGLVGATNQPAELAGYGPIPETLARTLLANAATFLRVATDPLTDEPLNLAPTRYRIRAADRALLRAMAGSCYWPNCTNPVLDTENDHLTAWEHGGRSTPANQRPACTLHHALRHFKDDKDRHGRPRRERDPARTGIKLRGWTPRLTPDGRVGWKAPSGRYHPPTPRDTPPPAYPKPVKKYLTNALNHPQAQSHQRAATPPTTPPTKPPALITPPSYLEELLIEYQPPHTA